MKHAKKVYLYGTHALMEALTNVPRVVRTVYLAPHLEDRQLKALLTRHRVPIAPLTRREAERMVGDETVHQGVIAVISPETLLVPFSRIIETLDLTIPRALVLLDEVQDPHNVGAIIRSAAAFGASAVLLPHTRQAPITGAVIKASAGMAFRIPLVEIGNVNTTVLALKDRGFRVYGLAMDGTRSLADERFECSSLFIVGNEGSGIRTKTLDHCDVRLSIPMHPRVESLNASVSAAIVLYQWSARNPQSLRAP